MTATDVIKSTGRRKIEKPNSDRPHFRKGQRVREVQKASHSNDDFLNYLRDVVGGPYQKLSEARFEEMLDILMEQDDFARSKFNALETGLDDVVAETAFLRQKCHALSERIELVVERSEAERLATCAAFEESIGKLREEYESKAAILSDVLQTNLKKAEEDTRRALQGLSATVMDSKRESTRLFELAQSSSLQSLESRIAQWRAEIEDERKEDMGEVAAALMDIGKRMLSQRHAPS